MTEQPRRHTADTINDDDLDQLYARAEQAEREADEAITAAAHLARLVGKRAEKAEQSATKQHRRAKSAETELRVLRAGLRANGADPTQIQNLWAQIHLRNRQWREEKQRAEQAEARLAEYEREYERALAWETSCLSCARVLDSARRETERAERAEADAARWRRGHETAEAQLHHGRRQLAELEAITARVRAECDRIEAAVRDNPTSPDLTGGYLACLRHIRAALDPQETRP